jgi:translin
MNLKKNFTEITKIFDTWDRDREEIIRISRSIIRDASIAIKSIHRKEIDEYNKIAEAVKSKLRELKTLVNKNPGVFYKYLKTPEQEYSEAVCFYSIISNNDMPNYADLDVDPLNYVLGLADVIGELRRYVLDNLRNFQVGDVNRFLESMDEIHTQLFSLDYPSRITQDLRHKVDVARSIIEKTRGDISISLQMSELRRCIEDNLDHE